MDVKVQARFERGLPLLIGAEFRVRTPQLALPQERLRFPVELLLPGSLAKPDQYNAPIKGR